MEEESVACPVYLFGGVTEAEAELSLAVHGDPKCAFNSPPCSKESVMIVLIKTRAGADFGEELVTTAACEEHREGLEAQLCKAFPKFALKFA